MNLRLFSFRFGRGYFWFRLGRIGRGISFTNLPPLFSERNGLGPRRFRIWPTNWRFHFWPAADAIRDGWPVYYVDNPYRKKEPDA